MANIRRVGRWLRQGAIPDAAVAAVDVLGRKLWQRLAEWKGAGKLFRQTLNFHNMLPHKGAVRV